MARLSDHWGRGVGFCGLCDNVDCVQEGCIGKRKRLLSGGWKVENVRFAPTAGRRGNACPRGSETVSGGCLPTCARNAPDTLTQEGCRDKAWRVQGEKFADVDVMERASRGDEVSRRVKWYWSRLSLCRQSVAVVSRKWSNAQPTTHETSELRGCRQSLGGRRKVCVNRALFHIPGGATMLTIFDAPPSFCVSCG